MGAREEFATAGDVLFVDEASHISLANVLAVSQAANSLVRLGDPRQLDQPEKASHSDGVGVSALQHVLGEHETTRPWSRSSSNCSRRAHCGSTTRARLSN